MRRYYVYILSSRSRQLYVGVTNNLVARLWQHRQSQHCFTSRYRIGRLVYYEIANEPMVAIAREKQIKGFRRDKKVALVSTLNPAWNDLSEDLV